MMIVNYFYLLQIKCPSLKRIIHKFLLRGHTHMEADHIHALIERVIKKQPTTKIFIEMQLSDFKNYAPLYSGSGSPLIHKKQTVDKDVFLISSAVWLEIRREDPGVLYYKTEILQDDYKMVNMNRSPRRMIELPLEIYPLRTSSKGISTKKYGHLITLLQWVPDQFHDFYKNMTVVAQQGDDDDDD
nr:unnamed protein product [Callosobruchus chinensis]